MKAKNPDQKIQTLHPQANKTNKLISLSKYNFIKDNILAILQKTEFTHTELMEELYRRVKDTFDGGIQWYGETVKLDLEARHIIERTSSKPEKYAWLLQARLAATGDIRRRRPRGRRRPSARW